MLSSLLFGRHLRTIKNPPVPGQSQLLAAGYWGGSPPSLNKPRPSNTPPIAVSDIINNSTQLADFPLFLISISAGFWFPPAFHPPSTHLLPQLLFLLPTLEGNRRKRSRAPRHGKIQNTNNNNNQFPESAGVNRKKRKETSLTPPTEPPTCRVNRQNSAQRSNAVIDAINKDLLSPYSK